MLESLDAEARSSPELLVISLKITPEPIVNTEINERLVYTSQPPPRKNKKKNDLGFTHLQYLRCS